MTDAAGTSVSSGFEAVVLDIAPAYRSREAQDAISDLILHLAERGYQVFLCVTSEPSMLQMEDFESPAVTFLRETMPPAPATLVTHPELTAPGTLWVTDDAALQEWIRARGLPFAFPERRELSFAPDYALMGYSDLATLLDPTAATLDTVASLVTEARAAKPHGALLIGIGGPPESGFQRFAVQLRPRLEEDVSPMVELLDLTPFLYSSEDAPDRPEAGPWRDPAAANWMLANILDPLRRGERIYFESRPPGAPADFEAHFPLFVSEESVVVVLGEMLFVPAVRDRLDVALLLEVSPTETARRLYELPDGPFEAKFTEQYLKGQGGRYRDYLVRNQVIQRSTLGIDANRRFGFTLRPRANA